MKYDFKHYIDTFNKDDVDQSNLFISNEDAFEFLENNIPKLNCPDKNIEKTYYFRWWVYCKHIFKAKVTVEMSST